MKRPQGPVPTLGQLRKSTDWTWLWCERCQHHAPMKFAPLIERWGADASSDKLRRCARCTACGSKGATLQHFLEDEVLPWFENRKKELTNRPLIREQAFGDSLGAERLERLAFFRGKEFIYHRIK